MQEDSWEAEQRHGYLEYLKQVGLFEVICDWFFVRKRPKAAEVPLPVYDDGIPF